MKQLTLFLLFSCSSLAAAEKPNILWFVVDDMSANFSCYGETAIQTPHVDSLAALRAIHAGLVSTEETIPAVLDMTPPAGRGPGGA